MKYLAGVATLDYEEKKCTGCRMCVEVCPRGVFIMDGKKAAITDRDLCMECGACALNCEYRAIKVDAGVGCATAVIRGMMTGGKPQCGCSDAKTECC